MIAFKQQKKYETVKKSTNHIKPPRKQLQSVNFSNSPQTKEFRVFQWGKVSKAELHKEAAANVRSKNLISQKFFTTDQSNNIHESKMHESIIFSKNVIHQNEQLQQPLTFKARKPKGVTRKRQLKNSKIQSISIKLTQMKQLVRSQDKQLKQLKYSLSQRQLHRLIKIHSIQKLRLLQNIDAFRDNSLKKNKRQ